MWVADVYEPILDAVPPEHRSKLEPAQLVIEVLDHQRQREAESGSMSVIEAAWDFAQSELGGMPDERVVVEGSVGSDS